MAASPKVPDRKGAPQKEATAEELRYIQQIYQNQYMLINQQIETSIAALRELEATRLTLENYDNIKGRKNLMPLGAGVFAAGSINDNGTVLADVGAGYMVERKVGEAKGAITTGMDKTTETIKKLQKNRKDIESALMDVSYKLDSLTYG